jgi:hypothetical protein
VQGRLLTAVAGPVGAGHLENIEVLDRLARAEGRCWTPQGQEVLRADMRQRDGWLALAMETHLTPAEQQLLRLAGELMERLAEADDVRSSARADDLTGTSFSV